MSFNLKALGKVISIIFLINGISMLLPIFFAIYYRDVNPLIFGVPALISLSAFAILFKIFRHTSSNLRIRDAYLSVIICWIVWSLFGSIPYLLTDSSATFIDAYFEAVSSYTTTGATLLDEWKLPHSLMFWRALNHWLGGMGILIFIISVLPSFGVGSQRIAAAETTGPGFTKTSAKMGDIARLLYLIYLIMTAMVFILFLIAPMEPFDALVNAMGCVSTSGLLLHPEGISYYDSPFIEGVVSIFTILAATNFVLYLHLVQKNLTDLKKNIEIRVFFIMILAMGFVISIALWATDTYDSIFQSLRYGYFQTISFITTTGYSITDYTEWPSITIALLFATLFIGGCAASTSGSMKVIRIIVLVKLISRGFYKRLHPRAVRSIKVGGTNISSPIVSSIAAFVLLYFATFIVGSLILSFQNLDMETTLSSTASLMSSTGISFGEVGGSGNYSIYTSQGIRLFMTFLMIVGRLELFTVFLLFMPSFWDPDKLGSHMNRHL